MNTNHDMATAWLSMITAGAKGAIERRTICKGEPSSRWHTPTNPADIARQAIAANATDGENVYFGPHMRSGFGKRGNASVIGTNVVFVEFDGPDHGNGGQLRETTPAAQIAEAAKRAADRCFPLPSMILHSGGGAHLYWLLTSFITDTDLIERLTYAMIAALEGDYSCSNLERIMRCAGTWNHTRGRMCELIECDTSRRYLPEDLFAVVYHGNTKDEPEPVTPTQLDALVAAQQDQRSRSGMSVIETFCDRVPVRDLVRRYGGTLVGDKYRRPGKDDAGFSGIVRRNKAGRDVLCTWSENDPANDHKFGNRKAGRRGEMGIHDSFSLFCLIEHAGDMRAAVKAAADLLGIRPPPQKTDAQVITEIAASEYATPFDALLFGAYSSDAEYTAAQARTASIVSRFTRNPKQLSRIISLLVTPEPAGACA